MKILETGIPDIQTDNIDIAKVTLADEIIEKISPLFDEVYSTKSNSIEEKKLELKQKRKLVLEDKNYLEALLKRYNREKKLKKLLNKVSNLVESGLAYDGNLKSETVVLLKILPTRSFAASSKMIWARCMALSESA